MAAAHDFQGDPGTQPGKIPKIRHPKVRNVGIILKIQDFWASHGGTLITQLYYTQVGAGL